MRKVDGSDSVIRIIPIEGDEFINGEPQKRFADIWAEIDITARLSGLRDGERNSCSGFVELLGVSCVRGCWPELLVEQWELFEENEGTRNDHPRVFGERQLFVVLELAYAGTNLKSFKFESAAQSLAALQQVSDLPRSTYY